MPPKKDCPAQVKRLGRVRLDSWRGDGHCVLRKSCLALIMVLSVSGLDCLWNCMELKFMETKLAQVGLRDRELIGTLPLLLGTLPNYVI